MEEKIKKSRGSGKWLNCEVCGKEFYVVPSRLKKNKHHTCSKACGAKQSSELYSKKVKVSCVICGKEIYYKQSHYKKIVHHCCSIPCAAKAQSQRNTENNPKRTGLNEEDRFFYDKCIYARNRAEAKKIAFNLDYIFLKELYYKQKGLCFYTKLPMVIHYKSGKKNKNKEPKPRVAAEYNVMSIDRIDSAKGYTKDNVVFCLHCVNMFKAHHKLEDIKQVFKAIYSLELKNINTKVKKLYPDSVIPSNNGGNNAGYDVYTQRIEDCGNYIKVYSGIALEPAEGYYYMLCPRSSIYKYGLIMHNSIGIIDNNFRGELIGIFEKTENYKEPETGSRLMQLIAQEQIRVTFVETTELSKTERNEGAFGSTGV